MNQGSLIRHLEANVVEEIAAKREALRCIEAQELSVEGADPEVFQRAMDGMNALLEGDASRARRRTRLLAELSELWRVPADALSLGAIVRRLGPEGCRLEELRAELRGLVADVLLRNRRLSSLIGMHRRINREIVKTVLGAEGDDALSGSGALLDAEA